MEAWAICQHISRIDAQTYGARSVQAADALIDLGLVYTDRGDYARAESLFKDAFSINNARLGKRDPRTAVTKLLLGIMYARQGKLTLADPIRIEALEAIHRRGCRRKHFDWDYSCNLAILCSDMGDYSNAEPLFARSLRKLGKHHAVDGLEVLHIKQRVAEMYNRQGRNSEAEAMAQDMLALSKKLSLSQNSETARTTDLLGHIYERTGRRAEAKSMYDQAFKIRINTLGATEPLTMESQDDCIRLLYI
jgi:tetratricopeptide (TPR) repeat protein